MDRTLAALVAAIGLAADAAPVALEGATPVARFPMAVGNRWVYRLTGTLLSNDPEQGVDGPFGATVTWRIDGQDEVRGEPAFRFAVEHTYFEGPYNGLTARLGSWFVERGDTLLAVASSSSQGPLEVVWAQLFKPAAEFPANAEAWHFVSLVYPLVEGGHWEGENLAATFLSGSDSKTVGPLQQVSVPAGSFRAYPVTYVLNVGGLEVVADQWFSDIGLVRLDVVERCSWQRTDESGQPLGVAWYERRAHMELVNYVLADPATQVQPASWARLKQR